MKDNKSSLQDDPIVNIQGETFTKVVTITSILALAGMVTVNHNNKQLVEKLSKEIEKTNAVVDVLQSEKDDMTNTLNEKITEVEELKIEMEEANSLLQDKEKELIKLESELKAERKRVSPSVSRGQTRRRVDVSDTGIKSYMNYTTITNRQSLQYQLQQQAVSSKGYRMLDGRYMVALGSRFGKVGTLGEVALSNGVTIPIIIGDQKADRHTDSTNTYHLSDGSVIEFIVDRRSMSTMARRMGDMSHCTNLDLSGRVISITTY